MKFSILTAFIAALLLILPAQTLAGDEAESYRNILDAKAGSIVTVKLILKVKISFMGQGQDMENESEVPGVVVHEKGLIMIADEALEPQLPIDNDQIDVKITPLGMTVIFADDDEEYDAILAAKDTNLGLAFVQVKDLAGKTIAPVSFDGAATVAVGQELVGVSRYEKGFDYAAYFGTIRVAGEVFSPRPLFAIDGGFDGLGLPLFTRDGKVAGVLAAQEGSEGAGGGGAGGPMSMLFDLAGGPAGDVFLLPADTVHVTIEQAKLKAAEALKKAAEEAESEE